MIKLFSKSKQNQTFVEDSQLSPILDPNNAPKINNLQGYLKNDSICPEPVAKFNFPIKNIKYPADMHVPQFSKSLTDKMTEDHPHPKGDTLQKQVCPSFGSIFNKFAFESPQKVWRIAGNIFHKHLQQIRSINQELLSSQQAQKLKEKIVKHINDCICLIKLQIKQLQHQELAMPHKQGQGYQEHAQHIIEIQKQISTQIDSQMHQQDSITQLDNSTTNQDNHKSTEDHLDLIHFCIQAFEQLSKNQTNLQDTITLMEKLFKTVENIEFISKLPCMQNLQLYYGQILLRCGFLKKVERCLFSLESVAAVASQKKQNENNQKERKHAKQLDSENEMNKASSEYKSLIEEKKESMKQSDSFDLSKYYCLYCEYLREQSEIDKCIDQCNNIQNPRKIEAFLLKIAIFIDRKQLEQALYLIEQGKQLFQRHKQPLVFLQLINFKLKILLKLGQYNALHVQFAEMKEYFEQSKLNMTIEFCESLCYEIQAYLARGNLTECTLVLDEATRIAKEILKDRYNQSSIIGDIYFLKAQVWYQQSFEITDEEERSRLLKHALSICQLCIKIRKNYLYAKSDKNHKVIDTLYLHVKLLAETNQNRECRKASAELVEYELI